MPMHLQPKKKPVESKYAAKDRAAAAQAAAVEWGRIPEKARVASKILIRKDAIDHMVSTRQEDADHFVGFVTHPNVQATLTAYLEALASKRKS